MYGFLLVFLAFSWMSCPFKALVSGLGTLFVLFNPFEPICYPNSKAHKGRPSLLCNGFLFSCSAACTTVLRWRGEGANAPPHRHNHHHDNNNNNYNDVTTLRSRLPPCTHFHNYTDPPWPKALLHVSLNPIAPRHSQ